jgi:hypothetical protein
MIFMPWVRSCNAQAYRSTSPFDKLRTPVSRGRRVPSEAEGLTALNLSKGGTIPRSGMPWLPNAERVTTSILRGRFDVIYDENAHRTGLRL